MADASPRAAGRGSLIEMASLIKADKAVNNLLGMFENRAESHKKTQSKGSDFFKAECLQNGGVPKLTLSPKKPATTSNYCNSPVSSARRPFQTARYSDSNIDHTILKNLKDEIKLLRMTV